MLLLEYHYLDAAERTAFAKYTHEYLIEHVQLPNEESVNTNDVVSAKLQFNHPTKELIWIFKHDKYLHSESPFFAYSNSTEELLLSATKRFVLRS